MFASRNKMHSFANDVLYFGDYDILIRSYILKINYTASHVNDDIYSCTMQIIANSVSVRTISV